jgi:predicted O-methyltransferase YrrM
MSRKPWLPDKAIEHMESVINSTSWVIEHGSGDSTLWLAERVDFLISYESDPKWYTRVGKELYQARQIDHVRLFYATDIAENGFKLPRTAPRGPVYDMILVDGRGRIRFWQDAEKYLKPGGWVFFDDAERQKYIRAVGPLMMDWEHLIFHKEDKVEAYTLAARKPLDD